MSSYHIIVTEAAEGEINSALEYLMLHSPNAARDFQDGMDEAILSLSEIPRRCPFAPEDGVITRPIRQLGNHILDASAVFQQDVSVALSLNRLFDLGSNLWLNGAFPA